MERLTRPTVEVDETAAKYMGSFPVDIRTYKDRLLELILNGPTLNGVSKDALRQIIRQLYGALKPYEDIGLEAGDIIDRLAKATVALMFEEENKKALDKLMEYQKAEQEGRLVVLDEPLLPLIWGDADHDTILCPNCRRDLMGGFELADSSDVPMFQCPYCGQPIDGTKAKEPEG